MKQHAKKMLQFMKKQKQTKTKTRNKQGLKISDFGLLIYEELPYIAASPDLELECICCGARLAEIKGPLISGEVPSADNLGN